MKANCPDLEALDQLALDPSASAEVVAVHVSNCPDCRARLEELSANLALFAELDSAGGDIRSRLAPQAPAPEKIAEFEIVREIGRGGMGVVYEARQKNPHRRVALKLLRADYAPSQERHRLFEREIRVLARLRHPGITAIFESGTSQLGPYYAMEFVQGLPLTEYAHRERLDLRARLQLFLKICRAVNNAHQHGVIHRDLKPGNILVEQGAAPKVLDFGLARITDPDISIFTLALDTGRLAGTLAYMSPEQTHGLIDEIDLRSDVYSLGVILFELLTGVLPYEVSRTSVPMAIRSICESPPRRPSAVASAPIEHSCALHGDLDTIILKTLEKSPEARYQSVAAVADDIDRFLSHQPILARPPTAIYQLRKFARRNRILVAGLAAVFLALALGIVTTTWQARRARQAERRAVAEAATSAEINRFLRTMFASVDPAAGGHDARIVDLLERAAQDLDQSFDDQPLVAIALRDAIGNAYKSLTLYPEAEPHFRAGLELARTSLGPESRQALQFQYALAEAAIHLGRVDEGLDNLRQTLDAQTRIFGPDDPDTLISKHFLAVIYADTGRIDESETLLRETLAGRSASLGPEHDQTLQTMNNLGTLLRRRDRLDEGARLIRRAHEISLRVYGPDHAQTIVFASHVAMLAATPAELEAVEPIFRDLVQRGSRVFGPQHQQTLAFLASLSQLLELRCEYPEARAVAQDLLDRIKKTPNQPDAATLDALTRLTRLTSLNKDYDQALTLAKQNLDLSRNLFSQEDPRTLTAMYDLTHALNADGKLDEALQLAQDTLKRRSAAIGEAAIETALARTLMAEILRKLGRLTEALPEAEQAASDARTAPDTADILIAWTESNLGACLRDQGRFAQAEPLLLSAHQQLVAGLGPCHPLCNETNQHIQTLYRAWLAAEPSPEHQAKLTNFTATHPLWTPSHPAPI